MYQGLDAVDSKAFIFRSRAWDIRKEDAEKLKGGIFCIHNAKSEPSSYGGEIRNIEFLPQEDNRGKIKAVVEFQATREAQGLDWPETSNPMEFLRVVIPEDAAGLSLAD
jgi:hypothetical protein